jgi:hypothetical protein
LSKSDSPDTLQSLRNAATEGQHWAWCKAHTKFAPYSIVANFPIPPASKDDRSHDSAAEITFPGRGKIMGSEWVGSFKPYADSDLCSLATSAADIVYT